METKLKTLPIKYELNTQIVKLLGKANEKYGEYKSLLKVFKFDQKYFLDSLILGESIRSSIIEGTKIYLDEAYYLDYESNNKEIEEVKALKSMLDYVIENFKNSDFDLNLINKMHKILLKNTRGKDKNPGKIRTVQNYIGLRNLGKEGAIYIPPTPEEVPILLKNLLKYMNELYDDETFIKTAISHLQFESIHPYNDGNGRLGRALLTLQISKMKEDEPILFLSEIIELYKANYYSSLSEYSKGNPNEFIKFFLICVIDQCTRNINRINKINKIYEEDIKNISDNIKGSLIYKLHPLMMKKIVFTSQNIAKELNCHINTVNKLFNKLVKLNIIEKEKRTTKITYRYIKVYNVFVEQI